MRNMTAKEASKNQKVLLVIRLKKNIAAGFYSAFYLTYDFPYDERSYPSLVLLKLGTLSLCYVATSTMATP